LNKKLHITVLVSNDLEFDQRVGKVCLTLERLGFDITLVGRLIPNSKPFSRTYEIVRFKLPFAKGAFFYASLNIRLFFYLLFKKTDVILANDLDTLLPAYLVSNLRSKKLVYDSHEYFTEAEGLTGRRFQKSVWLNIEKFIFPKLRSVYTVNDSIAAIYRKQYGVDVQVVRNIPVLSKETKIKSRSELGIPEDKKIVLLQGAFIDPDRGGIELVEAMQWLQNVHLYIIGSGRDIENLKIKANNLGLSSSIVFKGRMPYHELKHYTANADLGISIDKPLHLNYTLSLPNKLFDYLHAGTPVLVSNLPETSRIVKEYGVGMVCEELTSEGVAKAITTALNHLAYSEWKENCLKARELLCWQKEELVLEKIYNPILRA
jgi:glycosyltransferase involved in cell wall biosynthesis